MKLELGKTNILRVARRCDHGLYLSGGPEDILLPTRYIPEGTQIGDEIEVFVYLDAEERLTATTPQGTSRRFRVAAGSVGK